MIDNRHVVFIAAENGNLPGGKVGGVGDVIRDLPPAMAGCGWQTTVITPSFGTFQDYEGTELIDRVSVLFNGDEHEVEIYALDAFEGVRTILIHHALLAPTEPGRVYHDDGADRPYATDASKFAFFCAASAVWISQLDRLPDVVHLHDWHAAWFLLMKDFTPLGEKLGGIRTVFTIHNLAYQGQRPFEGDTSSLVAWFPGMMYDPALIRDPHAHNAVNPMAYAIRSCDVVNTVSPTYAREICLSSDPSRGFFGGEGLEGELANAAREGRLFGILNGCDYSINLGRRMGWQRLVQLARETLEGWAEKKPDESTHRVALATLDSLPKRRPMYVLSSVGRIVSQKMQLFVQTLSDGHTALEHLLDRIGSKGFLFLLGSGEKQYEDAIAEIATRYNNLVFLKGYAESFGNALYNAGDVFLMPSSFEPCGISQMLSMRSGQPCVVHGVGGLRDTVEDSVTGFVFKGSTPEQQAANFVASVGRAIDMRRDHPNSWARLGQEAQSRRFGWDDSAMQYVETLYEHN